MTVSQLLFEFPITQKFYSDHLFNLRFAAKELSRNAKKCEKQEKEEKNKLTLALKVWVYYVDIHTITHSQNLWRLINKISKKTSLPHLYKRDLGTVKL